MSMLSCEIMTGVEMALTTIKTGSAKGCDGRIVPLRDQSINSFEMKMKRDGSITRMHGGTRAERSGKQGNC